MPSESLPEADTGFYALDRTVLQIAQVEHDCLASREGGAEQLAARHHTSNMGILVRNQQLVRAKDDVEDGH